MEDYQMSYLHSCMMVKNHICCDNEQKDMNAKKQVLITSGETFYFSYIFFNLIQTIASKEMVMFVK